jgi:hypothetical protein
MTTGSCCPFTPESWAGILGIVYDYLKVKMISDEREK